jgi:hypothetical protein
LAGSSAKSKKKKERADESSSSSEEESKRRKRAGKKKAQRKKGRKQSSSSSSGTSDSEESSNSSSSQSDSKSEGSSTGDSEQEGKKRKRAARSRKGKKISEANWELLEELWPVEERPARLQSRRVVAGLNLSMSKLLRMKDLYVKEQERKGVGAAVFGRDRKPKKKKFKKMTDDGEKKLHPARFVGLPRVDPKLYWDQVPGAAEEIYRHVPLDHL